MSMGCIGEISYQDYIVVTNIEDATHWLAKKDSQSCVKDFIIPNKAYELIDNDFIISEDGCLSTYWMTHKGIFIKMKKS